MDWENEQYPLQVYPFYMVSKNRTLRAKGKKYTFTLKDIKMEPGSFEVEKKVTNNHPYVKIITEDELGRDSLRKQ